MINIIRNASKEPVVHFLCIGFILWWGGSRLGVIEMPENHKTISIRESSLIQYIQFQHKTFDDHWAKQRLLSLTQNERALLIDEYVREEVMVRHAIQLGMDQNDQIIRRRLIQKVEFITEDLAASDVSFNEDEARAYFEANRFKYGLDASISFAHVFLKQGAHNDAVNLLTKLKQQAVPAEQASAHGDRFYFHVNYVDRTQAHIRQHFGNHFSEEIFSAEPRLNVWLGPIQSNHGWHLVQVSRYLPDRVPEFEDVQKMVVQDLLQARKAAIQRLAVEGIRAAYDITYSEDLQRWLDDPLPESATAMQPFLNGQPVLHSKATLAVPHES